MTSYSYKTGLIYLGLALVLLSACNKHKKIDVSDIQLDVKIERFDKDFDSLRVKPMDEQAGVLYKKYGSFYTDFIERVLKAGSARDTAYYTRLRAIFADKAYADLKHDVDATYPNMDKQEAELTDAFRRIKYYYPKKNLPKVYAYWSGFEAQTSIGDGYFGIGLDLFLGADSRFYPSLVNAFPHYVSRRFTPDNIAPRVVEGIAREDMFPENEKDKSLLAKMVYNGKIMYFMDQVLPDVADSTKIGYTDKQIKWCDSFKADIWSYFLEENLLYESDYQKIQKYLNEAPFTPGLGENNESAPKLAIWTGWQIVRAYMDKHPEVTLPQLMADRDAQKILNEAKYRPKNP
ncbi:gliding motility lipoprotein GldB [Mucilaginibacter psychrotolerans]|uniref:Gliding motility lipoprotein GldB n=1 Tax=Mucilaginibacter psychrotolerans TaxID=1524096 RepID=A0A4Y8SES8_9SPHI|nr:gliding motility lipoprotein GldB [Mucilaginibacter psychrotolerans]TFF37549.1 gliding motility lipoprotein GldB [Mucilaginibacter psychrotolerans]